MLKITDQSFEDETETSSPGPIGDVTPSTNARRGRAKSPSRSSGRSGQSQADAHIGRAGPAGDSSDGLGQMVNGAHGGFAEPVGDLQYIIEGLKRLQSKRRFCIVSQSRSDRSCEAFIARMLGYSTEMGEASRKEMWEKVKKIRKAVEKGDDKQPETLINIVVASAKTREIWDGLRDDTERAMAKLVRLLPVYPWVHGIDGVGAKGLAILIGEAGDLSNYATVSKLWKRLGLAVFDGARQQRRTDKDEALLHGYNPQRRSEVWQVTSLGLFLHQWRGEKDGVPAGPRGKYGEVYARRKLHTADRDWTPKHRDNDAKRVMAKEFIKDLWVAWRNSVEEA